MSNNIIEKLRDKYPKEQIRDWAQKIIKETSKRDIPKILRTARSVNVKIFPTPGAMFFYRYDAITEDLPYFDKFPMIICINLTSHGWIGLNLHYLPPLVRFIFLSSIASKIHHVNVIDRPAFLKALVDDPRYARIYKKCIKQYSIAGLNSKFIRVPRDYWVYATLMSVEDFTINKRSVWKDTKGI